jgi:hypothetical protein
MSPSRVLVLEYWTPSADHHPGRGFLQWSQIEGLTEDRTRSHVHRFKIFLHPGRQPQKILIQGESLLNDAVSLLIFSAAVALVSESSTLLAQIPSLAPAAPGGMALGFILAKAYMLVGPRLAGTLSGILFEFAATFATWFLRSACMSRRIGFARLPCGQPQSFCSTFLLFCSWGCRLGR